MWKLHNTLMNSQQIKEESKHKLENNKTNENENTENQYLNVAKAVLREIYREKYLN